MIYNRFGDEVKIIQVVGPDVVIQYGDGDTDIIHPKHLKADAGLPEIVLAIETAEDEETPKAA